MVNAGDSIGSFQILGSLGNGGMGQLWVARHSLLGHRVVIKLLRPELSRRVDLVDRFFDEARAAAQIDDPGTVHIHDFGRHHGDAYIVMELLAGEVLSSRLARATRLPVHVAARLVMHAAMTMAVAHGRGIVHRDLKPDNLFVVPDPAVQGGERLKILDFGIAKLLVAHDTATRTQAGAVLGTPMYMSPEQCRSPGGVDHRTDIYALGCVLFHLLCGRPPFTGESSGELIAAHVVDSPPAPSSLVESVPRELDAVVARCLAKSPEQRYASMTELARALAPLAQLSIDIPTISPLVARSPAIGYLTTLGTGVGERLAPARSYARRTTLAFVAVAAAIVIISVSLVILWSRPEGAQASGSMPFDPPPQPPAALSPATPDAAPVSVDARAPAVDAPARARPIRPRPPPDPYGWD
ncbi:MAG: serine/threonine-protein kinase [Kofleriaceae bacterium]